MQIGNTTSTSTFARCESCSLLCSVLNKKQCEIHSDLSFHYNAEFIGKSYFTEYTVLLHCRAKLNQ